MLQRHGSTWAAIAVLGVTATACGGATAQGPVVETRFYALHSDPWVNLHHFLYQWSRADLGLGVGRAEVPVPERDGGQPDGADGEAWSGALAFYRENVGERDHFDIAMLELKTGLVLLGGETDATPPDEIPGVSAVLMAAMPVYLDLWWADHDAENRAFLDHFADDLVRYEDRWVETIQRVFGGAWLDGQLRLDASAYANWQGGYTSNGPPHTVMWSRDETSLTGLYGLELAFHESGHMSSLGAPLRRTVRAVFQEVGADEPQNLRHSFLFATAGELVRTIAEERGLPEHVPYIVREGLTGFAGWAPLWPPVVEHWLPIVEEGDAVAAIRAIAEGMR